MAQYYTLEEAASKLGLTADAFRKKLATEWKTTPRRYPDGATLRFQVREIDELSRTLGRGSDADVSIPLVDDSSSEDFIALASDDALGDAPKKGSGKIKPAGDSDVRLDTSQGTTRALGRPTGGPSEEIDLDAEQRAKPPSSKRLKKQPPPVTSEPDIHLEATSPPEGSSDFELSLAPDSSDQFDLQLPDDDSDEVAIGTPSGKGVKAGDSGINLQSPVDSGISLEKSSDFDLQMEGEGPKSPTRKGPKTDPFEAKKKAVPDDSDSEFELTLDDQANLDVGHATMGLQEEEQKDIFETDFELPALDEESGSEAVALEDSTDLESSDFDLAIDEGDAAVEEEESGSQVMAIPERWRRRQAAVAEDELDELDVAEEEAEEDRYRPAAEAEPAEWGTLAVVGLILWTPVMLLAGLMSWELLHGMWGYQQPGKVATPIVRTLAEAFGEDLMDERPQR